MKRSLWVGGLSLLLGACQMPAERGALPPLPEKVSPRPYAELLTRARALATSATEHFYVNRWTELEDTARDLEQTAKFLVKAEDVPTKDKVALTASINDLGKEAVTLREAAQAKDAKKANASLQKIHLTVRELRLSK